MCGRVAKNPLRPRESCTESVSELGCEREGERRIRQAVTCEVVSVDVAARSQILLQLQFAIATPRVKSPEQQHTLEVCKA